MLNSRRMSPETEMDAIVLVPFLIWGVFVLFSLMASVFWLWMLVDCAMNEPGDSDDKIVWVLIILFTSVIGALVYFLVRRPQRLKNEAS